MFTFAKALFSCEVIHAQETGWQSGVRSCIMSGLPRHLVQESNVDTVRVYQYIAYEKTKMK